MGRNVGVLLFLFLLEVALCKDYFRAATFEHRPRADLNGNERDIISSNLKFYEKAASIAATNDVDIILFNEYGLFPYAITRDRFRKFSENVPDPKTAFNPCVENAVDRLILHSLSCMARNNKIYIVGNMVDEQPCEGECDASSVHDCADKCPEDGILMYNTDVVFDPKGNLIARYHKFHPYFEIVNTDDENDFVTFETSFGKFGLIVCFDSVFQEASLLARKHGIDTMLFPTYWFDDIVPLNAVEFQQSWALANGVNFIAANTQTPGLGSLGSGIYSKYDGALVYHYDPDGESKLLMANIKLKADKDIPTNPTSLIIKENSVEPEVDNGDHFPEQCIYESNKRFEDLFEDVFDDYRCFKSHTVDYALVKLEKPSGKVAACHNGFCCSVSYSAEEMKEDYYLAVHNGTNNVWKYFYWGEETCLLTRCNPVDGKPCVVQSSVSKTVFKSLKMEAKFTTDVIYATVSKTQFRLAPKQEWNYETKDSKTKLHFQPTSKEPLLKVAMMGRCYHRDPPFVPYYKF